MEVVFFSPPKIPYFLPPATCSSYNNHHNNTITITIKQLLPNTVLTNLTIRSNFINGYAWSGTTRATTPPSPPSPPDPDKLPSPPSGIPMTLSRFKDVAQVFVGVLFWMVVFFWASAWDGRDNGKSDKGSRF